MYRVLVPVDDKEGRTLRQVSFVASLPNADEDVEVYLLFVNTNGLSSKNMPEEMREINIVERVASIRAAVEIFENADIDYHLLEESGKVADDIIDKAESLNVDLIVLGGRKRSPAGKVIFGSITQEVLLETDCPTTVTGGGD